MKLGSRACGEEKRRDDEEDEKEKSIQDKINNLRREAGKRNSRGRSINSAPKRRKTDEDNTYEETRTVANHPLNDEIGEKRKLGDQAGGNLHQQRHQQGGHAQAGQ